MDFSKISEIISLMNLIINNENVTENRYSIIARESLVFIQEKLVNFEDVNNDNNDDNTNIIDCGKSDKDFLIDDSLINDDYFQLNKNPYNYQDILKISEYMKKHPDYNFKSVKSRYKKLSSYMFYKIKTFNKNNNNVGFENSKIQIIKEKLFMKFKDFRERHCKVSQKCLRLWAIKIAKSINYPKFKAGMSFINEFQKEYGISGRRINKFLNKKIIENEDNIQNIISKFRTNFQEKIYHNFNQEYILNADQTNFKYELTPKRTLALKGQKTIKMRIQNKNSTTHSYTLMPTISMSGKCFGMFLHIYFCMIINFLDMSFINL